MHRLTRIYAHTHTHAGMHAPAHTTVVSCWVVLNNYTLPCWLKLQISAFMCG